MQYPNYAGYTPTQQFNQPPYTQPQFRGTGIEVVYATESEATNNLVDMGKKVLFIITDKPMMIYKSTDYMGFSTMQKYKTEKIEDISRETPTAENNSAQFIKKEEIADFITKSDFEKVQNDFKKEIDELRKNIKLGKLLEAENDK